MYRLASALATLIFFCGCAGQQAGGQPVAQTASSPSGPGAASPPQASSPTPSPASSPTSSPTSSPSPPRDPVLVFVRNGALSLVRPDGSVIASTTTTTLDSGEVAQTEFIASDGALIGHYWDSSGNPTSPLAVALLDRTGAITPLAPGAAKFIAANGAGWSPIVIGHFMLVVVATFEKADYIRLDLTTGKATVLLTAIGLPSAQLDGPPPTVAMTALGTTADRSVARVVVSHVLVDGKKIDGTAYFDLDLRSTHATGPYPVGNVGRFGISADGRFIGWWQWAPVSGSQKDLHVRELVSGKEWMVPSEPYQNEADHGGIRFSPDDRYVVVEGFGSNSQMGFAVYDMATHALIRSIAANEPDEPFAEVPLWWTDDHTVVYKTVDASGTASGHWFDMTTGAISDYPAELGAPVLMLG